MVLNVAEIVRKSSGRFSLYLRPVCYFSFRINSKKSKSPPLEEVRPKIYEHDVCAYLMRLSENIQNEPTDLIDGRLGALMSIAFMAIGELSNLAEKGNKEAATGAYHHLASAVNWFEKFCHEKPELFEPLARKTASWPSFISRQKAIIKHNEKLMAKLHLAADYKGVDLKSGWSIDAPEIKVALWLRGTMNTWREQWQPERIRQHKAMQKKFRKEFGYIPKIQPRKLNPIPTKSDESQGLAKNLPPFNKKTYPKWLEASWPLFLARYGEEFQNQKCFARFIPIAQKMAHNEKKKLRGELRKYITERISLAFEKIAPDVELKTQN